MLITSADKLLTSIGKCYTLLGANYYKYRRFSKARIDLDLSNTDFFGYIDRVYSWFTSFTLDPNDNH